MIGASNLLLKELEGLSFIESVRMKHILYDSSWPSFKQQVVLKVSLLTRWFYNYLSGCFARSEDITFPRNKHEDHKQCSMFVLSALMFCSQQRFYYEQQFPFHSFIHLNSEHLNMRGDCDKYWGSLPTLLSCPDHVIKPDNDDGDESWLWESLSWSWLTRTSPGTRTSSPHLITQWPRQRPPVPHMPSWHHLQICFNQQSSSRISISDMRRITNDFMPLK